MQYQSSQPQPDLPTVLPAASTALVRRSPYASAPYGLEPGSADAEVGLFQYWNVIRRNARPILLWGVLGLVVGFAVGLPMHSLYRTAIRIEILPLNSSFLNLKDSSPVNDYGDYDVSEEETQAALLSSESLLKRVATRLVPNFDPNAPVVAPAAGRAWQQFFPSHRASSAAPPVHPSAMGAAAFFRVASSLKVKSVPHTRLIEATAESPDPALAAAFLNTLSQEFIQQNQESRLVSTQHTGDWLSKELQDARLKLQQSEDALQHYARESGIVLTSDNTNVATERLQQYQSSLSAATADRIAKQSSYELARNTPPESLADLLNDPTLRDTQSKINDIKRQIADLSAIYNPQYSKLRRFQAELDTLNANFDRQRADLLESIHTDYEKALRKERLLQSAYSDQTREVTGQGEKSIQYNILKHEVDSNRQLYDVMLQQMKQASIANAMRASNVRVVDAAAVPLVPVSPNFPLNSAIGFVGGLLASTFVILIRDQGDQTLRSIGDIKLHAELPELGTIPNAAFAQRAYSRFYLKAGRNLPPDPDRNVAELTTWQKAPGLLAESFRSALTSILYMSRSTGARHQVLVVTSGSPSEGKTTTVSNLALAAAEIRLRVLVIDADLRRPLLHSRFNVSNDHGLTNLLDQDLAEGDLASAVRQTSVPNLHLLPAGPETQSAAHLLHSPNLAAIIAEAREQYDLIFIDTPPMLQMTDARIVATHADSVILVARSGTTSRQDLLAAKQRFAEDATPVLGSLLNDWSDKRSNSYYKSAAAYASRS